MQDKTVKHYRDMTREELLDLVHSMSWMALNLAQHLESAEYMKVQYRKNIYHRAIQMAWEICSAWEYEQPEGNMEIAYFGGNGLEVTTGDISQLVDGTLPGRSEDREIEFDYGDFDQLYMFLDDSIPSEAWIKEQESRIKYLRDLTDDKFNKDHVDVKVKTLNKALFTIEQYTELAKTVRKIVDVLHNERSVS